MKTIVTCLFLMIGASLTAQTKMEELFGDWKVKSFVANGKTEDASGFYFLISMTDDGAYTISQVYVESSRNVVCTATAKDQGAGKYTHQFISSTSSDAKYTFWLTGTYTYSLSDEVLTLTGENKKVVLVRK